jgi:hypothetical protein
MSAGETPTALAPSARQAGFRPVSAESALQLSAAADKASNREVAAPAMDAVGASRSGGMATPAGSNT